MGRARTEAAHPNARGLQAQPPQMVLERLLGAQLASAETIRAALPALERAAVAIAGALRGGHCTAYAGAGSSGLMALADALELAGTFGIPRERTPVLLAGGTASLMHLKGSVEDDVDLAAQDLKGARISAQDVVICVSASGRTPYTCAVADGARARGAAVIGIANVVDGPLLLAADIAVLLDTGPEMVAGSTRMAAATAQKIALNMLSTLAGLHLGHVHDGLMVNLVADNAKLQARATRIVGDLAGVDEAGARAALAAAGWAVKPAVLLAAGAHHGAEASEMLRASGGHLGPALDRLARGA